MTVLVVVAHPDDEALGFAGVIAHHRAAGRRVRVAVVTNGDATSYGRLPLRFCGAPRGRGASIARFGTCRNRETVDAMQLLGLMWSLEAKASDVLFLGYPNYALETIAAAGEPWTDDATGLHQTYALGASWRSCDGDLRYLVDGRHSKLSAADLDADVRLLLELTEPADVYTHVDFDGHPDHAETSRRVTAALDALGMEATVHATLIHPESSGGRMFDSANEWPNPADAEVSSPFDRFTPQLGFEPPPPSWGPLGAPNELVEVPAAMADLDPARNLKWQVISRHASQIVCRPNRDGTFHASCGYMRAFVKRHEFFWTQPARA